MTNPIPTPEQLCRLIDYDPNTGALTWKDRGEQDIANPAHLASVNSRLAGEPALSADDGDGYQHGMVMGRHLKAHRVAWAIHNGAWPDGDIDHINGNRSDNRIDNLREVSRGVNAMNRAISQASTSGCTGVYHVRRTGRWRARIKRRGRAYELGSFTDFTQAAHARKRAEADLGFHPGHGRNRLASQVTKTTRPHNHERNKP